MTDHTVRSFDAELKQLRELVLTMADAAIAQLRVSTGAQRSRDIVTAQRVVDGDRRIDELQSRIEEGVIEVIAKRQPVAIDLRTLIATMKIATDFERIGDLGKSNAKRVMALVSAPQTGVLSVNLERLGRLVVEQLEDVRTAFAEQDAEGARAVWERDSEVDNLETSLLRELLTYMMEDPRNIGACTHLLLCARNLERAGDHATNIAEQVHFIVTGKPMPLDRPRGERATDLPA